MKRLLLSCTFLLASFGAFAQGTVILEQDFESNMNGFISFNEWEPAITFTRGTTGSFVSTNMPVPNLPGSAYCVGYNDDVLMDEVIGADVYLMTAYADYSMYDSVRLYFDYYAPGSHQGSFVVVGQTGDYIDFFSNSIFVPLENTTTWKNQYVTITPATFSLGYGMNNVSVGFNYYDGVAWNTGLLVDNVKIIGYRQSPNENCANAQSLTTVASCVQTNSYVGNMAGATGSSETALCYGGENAPDVWFKFEATNPTATVRASALNLYDLDILLEIYEGECGSFTLLQCQNADDITNNGTGEEVVLLTDLTAGQTYYIRMFSSAGPTGLGGFRICVESNPSLPCNQPVVIATETTICENQQTTLSVTGATNVQWRKDGVAIAGQTGTTYTVTQAGTYSVTLTDEGCTTVTSNAIGIQVIAAPTRTQTLTICEGQSVTVGTQVYTESGTFTATIAAAEGCDSTVTTVLTVTEIGLEVTQNNAEMTVVPTAGAAYQWINCDTDEVVATTANFTATASGAYKLVVSVGDCSDETQCYEVEGLKVNATNAFNLEVYPNPTHNNVTITAGNQIIQKVAIYDNNGRLIETIELNERAPTISLAHLSNGLYMLHVTANDNTVIKKVTKQL